MLCFADSVVVVYPSRPLSLTRKPLPVSRASSGRLAGWSLVTARPLPANAASSGVSGSPAAPGWMQKDLYGVGASVSGEAEAL